MFLSFLIKSTKTFRDHGCLFVEFETSKGVLVSLSAKLMMVMTMMRMITVTMIITTLISMIMMMTMTSLIMMISMMMVVITGDWGAGSR